MNYLPFFRSIIEQDSEAIVICDLNHTIIYMNSAAKERYKKHGNLIGKNIFDCHGERSREMIKRAVDWFSADKSHNRIFTFHKDSENMDVYMVALRDENTELIGYYEKHEHRDPETQERYNFA